MFIYILTLIFCLILLSLPLEIRTKSQSTKLIYPLSYFSYILLILFAGFRYGIGTDYFNYQNIFFNINADNVYNLNLELGFRFLMRLFPQTDNGFYSFIFFISVLNNVLLFKVLQGRLKNSTLNERILIVIFFFITNIYFFPFNGIRQGIACAFVLLSYKYIINRSLWKFLICIFLGFLFHKSIIAFIPLYFFYKLNLDKKINLAIIIASLIIVKFGLFKEFVFLLNYVGEDKYNRYLYKPPDFGGSGLGVYLYLMLFLFVFIISYANKSISLKKTEFNFLFFIFSIGIALRIFSLENIIFVRLSYFFTYFDFIFIPYFILSFTNKNKILISFLFISIYLVTFIAALQNSNGLIPYNNILL